MAAYRSRKRDRNQPKDMGAPPPSFVMLARLLARQVARQSDHDRVTGTGSRSPGMLSGGDGDAE
jgi:hypothetical protein